MVFPEKRDDFGLNLSFSCSPRQAWYIPQFINKEARESWSIQLWQSQLNIEYIGRLLPDAAFLQTHFLHQPVVRPKALLSFFLFTNDNTNIICLWTRNSIPAKKELIIVQLRVTFARKKSYTNAHIWRECWVKVDVEQKDWRALANALFLAGKRWEGVLECCLVSLPAQTYSRTWWWGWPWTYLWWWWPW